LIAMRENAKGFGVKIFFVDEAHHFRRVWRLRGFDDREIQRILAVVTLPKCTGTCR